MGPVTCAASALSSHHAPARRRGEAMILIWACLIAASTAHNVTESTEVIHDPGSNTTTTLYPVPATNGTTKPKISSTASWKIETTFSDGNLTDSNSTESKESLVERPANESKEFKPSQHLGSYLEVTSPEIGPPKETFGFSPVIKKPPVGFIGSQKPDHHTPFKFPKEVLKNYNEFPYKFEKAIYTRAKNPTEDPWRPNGGLEATPTDEAPSKVPAGGLYKLPAFNEADFKEKPTFADGDFGLEFSDAKDHTLRKRPNPWRKLLQLATALIPVGIIVSALTPNVITVESNSGTGSQRPYRHVDTASGNFLNGEQQASAPTATPRPLVSERCRRRLLCELHADYNYNPTTSGRRSRCHRIRCEDAQAVADTLDFLLSYHQNKAPHYPGGQGKPKY